MNFPLEIRIGFPVRGVVPSREGGFLSGEIVFSLFLIGIVLSLVTGSVISASRTAVRVAAADRIERLATSLRIRLQRSTTSATWHGVPNLLVHRSGAVTDAEGDPMPMPQGQSRPSDSSDAITARSLWPGVSLRLTPVVRGRSLRWPAEYCIEHPQLSRTELREVFSSRAFVGVTVSGQNEYTGSVRTVSRRECSSGLGARIHTTLRPHPHFASALRIDGDSPVSHTTSARPEVLIPIREIFTIYSDRRNTLRLFSHLTRFSQPLAYGVTHFSVANVPWTEPPDPPVSLLEVRLTAVVVSSAPNRRDSTGMTRTATFFLVHRRHTPSLEPVL